MKPRCINLHITLHQRCELCSCPGRQVDGSVFIVYNVGLTDHVIRDRFVKLNDRRYHVVRFTRRDANATLQIDDHPIQRLNPTGARAPPPIPHLTRACPLFRRPPSVSFLQLSLVRVTLTEPNYSTLIETLCLFCTVSR